VSDDAEAREQRTSGGKAPPSVSRSGGSGVSSLSQVLVRSWKTAPMTTRPASDATFEIVLQKVLNMLDAELEDVNTNPATVQQLAACAAALKAHVS